MAITDGTIQLPGDSTGKRLDTSVLTVGVNDVHRERVNIVSPESTGASAIAQVSSSGGLSVTVTNPSTAVTVTNPSTAVNVVNTVTVTATQATNPWSSAPSFNVPIISASSGLVQISGTPTVVSASSGLVQISGVPAVTVQGSSGGTVLVTTSGALSVTLSTVGGSGSTSVSLSSTPFFSLVGTSSAPATVTSSGGLEVTIVSGAGAGSSEVHIVGTSGGIAPVTTSGGLAVTIISGAGAGSSEVHIVGTGNEIATVTTSAGLNVAFTNASGPVTTSAGVYVNLVSTAGTSYVVTTSAGLLVNISSGTVTSLSASSGNVGVFPSTSRQMLPFTFNSSSSNSHTVVTSNPAIFYGWNVGNQTTSGTASIKVYNSTAATVGSTTNLLNTIPIPGGSAGGGNNLILPQGVAATGGLTFVITANFGATSTGSVAAGDVVGSLYYNT